VNALACDVPIGKRTSLRRKAAQAYRKYQFLWYIATGFRFPRELYRDQTALTSAMFGILLKAAVVSMAVFECPRLSSAVN
jgi:hypothetical protein